MNPRSLLRVAFALACMLAAPLAARGQGFVVDRWPHQRIAPAPMPIGHAYEVREVNLDARIRDQVAEVQVSQTFHNPGSIQIEAEYLFPLPEEGAVQNFVLLVDGKELPGRLMAKDEARRIYEEIVRTRRDPALLEYMGRGLYRSSVFPIPPGADRKLTMRYTQVCKRDRDVVEFSYPFSNQKFTAKPIDRLKLSLRLESRDSLKSLYCPTYDTVISRPTDHEATVSFEQRHTIPTTDFRLIYTLAEGAVGATVLSYRPTESEDGYFVLLASPRVRVSTDRRPPKTVVFVLDRSGSMAGKKIEQARNALRFVLNNLRDDDTFNIIAYDDRVETFKPELQACRYSSRTRDEAVRFIDNIREGGGTNIDEGLKAALGMIHDDSRPSYVLFLTDGLPTVGETRETAIAANGKSSNRYRARIFAFGVGYDVNARLLDRLSGGNSGTSEYVKPDEDIESHVARFYGRMTSPALADIRMELTGTDINRVYPRDLPDLFEGNQLVVAGRYRGAGNSTVRISGKVNGERQTFEFPTELASTGRGSGHAFVETLWATRRVGDLIDQIDMNGSNKELIDELVAISTKYGILTPYTSFLADERVPLGAVAANVRLATESLQELSKVSGEAGVAQRHAKQSFMAANQAATPASSDQLSLDARLATSAPAAAAPARLGRGAAAGTGMGGMMMGGRGNSYGVPAGGGMGGMGPGQQGQQPVQNQAAANVRRIGTKTFFRKGNAWLDSSLKDADEKKAKVVQQFSDAFFELARNQKPEFNQYLTFEEPVTVSLEGQVYRFEQAPR